MHMRVLGALEVTIDGVVINLRPKEAELLCSLAVEPGRSVKEHQLLEALWGEPPPPSASKSLQSHVARLRAAIGMHRIERTRDGYRLTLADVQLDVVEYERMAATASDLDEMGVAIAMWRGNPYDELDAWPPAIEARSRLDEIHAALEERVGACLLDQVGAARAVPELDRLARARPLRERRWAMLAAALAADGRSAEALRTVHRAREHLRETSGIEIGTELKQVEHDILDGTIAVNGPVVDRDVVSKPSTGATPVPTSGLARLKPRRLAWLLVPLLLLSSGVGGWIALAGGGGSPASDAEAADADLPATSTAPTTVVSVGSPTPATTSTALAATSTVPPPTVAVGPAEPTYDTQLVEVDCIVVPALAVAPTDRQGPLRADTQCFHLTVPQRRGSPTSPDVRLDVALQPGAAGEVVPVIAVGDFRSLAVPAPGAHVVVALRGGPGSDPGISCGELVGPLESALGAGGPTPDALTESGAACAARLLSDGIELDAFGSIDAADDVADLAEQLGYEQIQLQVADGVGTWIAQRLIERHDGLVASLVLQDPVAIGQVVPDHIPTTLAAAWRQYVALCSADTACTTAYPELDSDWDTFVAAADASPVTVVVNTADSPTGVDVVIGQAVLDLALSSALDIPATLPLLAGLVHGRDSEVAGRFVGSIVLPGAAPLPSGAGFWCTDEWAYHNSSVAESQARLSPRFGRVQDWKVMERGLCAVWPHAAPSAPPTALDVPTLVIRGRLSPYLDPAWDSELARVFPDQRSLELPSVTFGTGANTPPCLNEVLAVWWSSGAVEQTVLDQCGLDSPPLSFAVG